jgi:hypothetical protein
MTSKSFESIWKEYVEYCEKECEDGGIECSDMIADLEETKLDYMHFYDFLRYSEELNKGD